MVLTGAQTLAFFTNEDQMGVPAETVAQMEQEGITNVDDLAEFDNTRMTVPKLKSDAILLASCRPRKSWRTFRARKLRELKGPPSWLKFNKTAWFSTRL